jgi:nitronate monooxygenase
MCRLVEELKPEVVSFHFGLPEDALLKRVKAAGCIVLSSATIVKEAIWLEEHGADVIIAQGAEAGGHRGMFLTENIAEQPGLFALVPQVVDAVKVPVIAAGGIAGVSQRRSRWARPASRSARPICVARNQK